MKIYKPSVVLAAALFAAGLSDATAAAQLRLSDGTPGGTFVIVDQGPDDSNPQVGVIVYTGGVGVTWIVGTAAGVSKPVIGSPTAPYLDLNTIFVSQGAGPLTVEFTDTGFTGGGAVTAKIGGNTAGNVTYRTYADPANAPFGKSSLLTSQGPLTGLGFSGTATGTTLNPSAPYSLTLETIIQHGGPGRTGFDADLFITPPPRAAIGDFVFSDQNTNGLQDVGEPGVSNVLVSLIECVENTVVATTNTDINGLYLFADLIPGSYRIMFTAPNGFVFTTANVGANDALDSDANETDGLTGCYTLVGGQTNRTVDAGLFEITPHLSLFKTVLPATNCVPLTACTPPYPFASANPRTSIVFNESEVLRAFTVGVTNGCLPTQIRVYYNDEHALLLGTRRVIVKDANGTTTTDYPVSPLTSNPGSVLNPQVGSTFQTGDQAGTDVSGRPIYPSLYITDITDNPNDLSGDWQFGGTAIPPHAVFGTWKAAIRVVDNTRTPPLVEVNVDPDPEKNDWDLDGGDPAPAGLVNQGYGAEVRWDTDRLGLVPGRTYRLYFTVHDGDQNKQGGDVGQGCAILGNGPTTSTVFTPGSQVTYGYVVTNDGNLTLTNVVVTDDNGTVDFPGDDEIVGIVSVLAPGQSQTFSRRLIPPVTICTSNENGTTQTGLLITKVLPNGDVETTFIQGLNVNDNTYGTNAIGWGSGGHTFGNLTGSDQATFSYSDASSNVVLAFKLDYISASGLYPSGYGSLGVTGGDGDMIEGNASNIVSFSTSLAENLNKQPFLGQLNRYTVNSPGTNDPNRSQWEYRMIYRVVVRGSAFAASGLDHVAITSQHNSPAKDGFRDFRPLECGSCVTNIATATARFGTSNLFATADAFVCSPPNVTSRCPMSYNIWADRLGQWPATYSSSQTVGSVFQAPPGIAEATLLRALAGINIGKEGELFKHAVAALLNAAHPDIRNNFFYYSIPVLISEVNAAVASGDEQTIHILARVLETANKECSPPKCPTSYSNWPKEESNWSPTGYSRNQTVGSVFNAPPGAAEVTLRRALEGEAKPTGGSSTAHELYRHGVAALLNAAHPTIRSNFAFTVDEVIRQVNAAIATGNDRLIYNLAKEFERLNLTCAAPSGALGDFVWSDTNGNGVQDSGEPGIPNVSVLLMNCTGTVLATNTTGSNGQYLFSNLRAGNYRVRFTAPAGTQFTTANTGINDLADSDADPDTGLSDCVTLGVGAVNRTVDAGLVDPNGPRIRIVKTADKLSVFSGGSVTYSYGVTNIGGVALINIVVTDDNGTPGATSDDFVAGTIASLAAGQGVLFQATRALPQRMCMTINNASTEVGSLISKVLPNGDVEVNYLQSRNVVDNTYGVNAVGYPNGHTFNNLLGSDKAQFVFSNGLGQVVLDVLVDYISASANFPSGYGSLGVTGGEGRVNAGSASSVVSATTSITRNLNQSSAFYGFTVNSPAPETNFPTWDYVDSYTVVIRSNAFGSSGFGGVAVPSVHNSPSKLGFNEQLPSPCSACVTNLATVTARAGNLTLSASDTAFVCVNLGRPAAIGDFVWSDLNNNGVQNSGEPGVPNIVVQLEDCAGAVLGIDVTGANGEYLFSDLPAGSYRVRFFAPAGMPFTTANAGSNDAVDSDADPNTGLSQCVTLAAGQINRTVDAGLVDPNGPRIRIVKTADKLSVFSGGSVTYSYGVTNIGGVALINIVVTDDNGTPGSTSDDFVAGTIASLAAGQGAFFQATTTLAQRMCMSIDGTNTEVGSLVSKVLPNGDVEVNYLQSRNVVDNTFGVNAVGYPNGHTFNNLLGSDKAQFVFSNRLGQVVLDVLVDYVTASANFPSGYGSLGVTGGEGRVNVGSAASVVSATTSISSNLNQSPAFYGFTVNSPAPESNFPTWDYVDSYTVVIRSNAFGASGFGGVAVPSVHNSPSKLGFNEVLPKPCEACVTNLATVTARANNLTVSASDTASVCVNPGVAPASPVLRMGLVNGRLALSWPDSAEGFILESATTAKGVWTPVNATPTVVTGRKVVTVPAAGQRFFRLRKP